MCGSSLMQVTDRPRASRRQPIEDAARPLPRLETTPPVTKMYLGIVSLFSCWLQPFFILARLVAFALSLFVVVVARLQILLHLYGFGGLRVDERVERAHPGHRGGPRRTLRLRDAALILLCRH